MTAIAIRNLAERKLRTALTALAIVLGVMMVAGTYVLTDTIDNSFEQIFTQSNEGTDAVVTTKQVIDTDDGSLPAFPASILNQVKQVDGVAEAAGGDRRPAGLDHRLRRRAARRQRRPEPRLLRPFPSASTRSPTWRAARRRRTTRS